jgi:hypothetical protein
MTQAAAGIGLGVIDMTEDWFRSEVDLGRIGTGGFCAGAYWLFLDSPVFYGRLMKITLAPDEPTAVVYGTMVQKSCTFCIRAVLEWGSEHENPADLDFHVLNVAQNEVGGWKPEGCQDDNEVYWDDQRGPKWGGVSLDVDATAGYGPETVTFAAGVENGQYNLVVNVYTKGVEEADGTFANDPNHRMVVRIYDGTGLIAVALPSSAVRAAGAGSAWWVGTVTKATSGYRVSAACYRVGASAEMYPSRRRPTVRRPESPAKRLGWRISRLAGGLTGSLGRRSVVRLVPGPGPGAARA